MAESSPAEINSSPPDETVEESLSLETDADVIARADAEVDAFMEDPEKEIVKLAHRHAKLMEARRLRFLERRFRIHAKPNTIPTSPSS